jgi:23S rRNA (adenine-N6)-dimethyltransferase
VPAVDAGILRLTRRPEPFLPTRTRSQWTETVRTGFRGVGGSLHASLCTIYPRRQADRAFDLAAVARDTVVGYVAPQQWLDIFTALQGQR